MSSNQALNPINKILDATPITLKEQSFYEVPIHFPSIIILLSSQEYAKDLTTARDYCRAFERTGDATELTRAWEIYYTVGGGVCPIGRRNQFHSITSDIQEDCNSIERNELIRSTFYFPYSTGRNLYSNDYILV